MIIDQFNLDPKKNIKGEFEQTILPEQDKDIKFKKKDYPSIHVLLVMNITIVYIVV